MNKLLQIELLVVFIFFSTCSGQTSKKLSILEFDTIEINKINRYNETRIKAGLAPIRFSRELMDVAIDEAISLENSNFLSFPKFKTTKSFRGYSIKVTGFLGDKYGIPHFL
jgi:hypothetical protein